MFLAFSVTSLVLSLGFYDTNCCSFNFDRTGTIFRSHISKKSQFVPKGTQLEIITKCVFFAESFSRPKGHYHCTTITFMQKMSILAIVRNPSIIVVLIDHVYILPSFYSFLSCFFVYYSFSGALYFFKNLFSSYFQYK